MASYSDINDHGIHSTEPDLRTIRFLDNTVKISGRRNGPRTQPIIKKQRCKNHQNGVNRRSLRELRDTVMNCRPRSFITLVFPRNNIPKGANELKNVWRKMRRKLCREFSLSGVMTYEFKRTRDGWPHIHLAVTQDVWYNDIMKCWVKVTGGDLSDTTLVDVKEVDNPVGLGLYMGKIGSKRIPHRFQGVDRVWAKFGGLTVPVAETILAPRSEIEDMIRALKEASGHNKYSRWIDTEESGCRVQTPLSTSQIIRDVYGPEAQEKEFASNPIAYAVRK